MRNKSNKLMENSIEVNELFSNIKELVINSRNQVYRAVNQEMLNLHWNIGKMISTIQGGTKRAAYGEKVLNELSRRLTDEFGKGFSIQNLRKMRQFYHLFQIRSSVMSELSWTYYLYIIQFDAVEES